ncbi:peptidase inhibitor family I36 protein [Actinoplanes sp. NPDC051494]|uniref:peptidase inhibitor family I36 protein n=1 Tax=Actinoplanes sp. NPDC051494 TaxID=3363907 RepID=UPI003787EFCD
MRRIALWLVALTIGIAGSLVATAPAEAALSECSPGQVCLWGENDYSGCFRGMTNTGYDYNTIVWSTCTTYSINNGANSVRNYGNSCAVALFDGAQHTGPAILFNRVADNYNYQDPKLSNGGGVGFNGAYAGQNWQDRISSHKFCP